MQEGILRSCFFFSQCHNKLQYQNVYLESFIDKNPLQLFLYCVNCLWLIDCLFLQVSKEKHIVSKERLWLCWRIMKVIFLYRFLKKETYLEAVTEGGSYWSKSLQCKKNCSLTNINQLKYLQKITCLWKPLKRKGKLQRAGFFKANYF